MRPYFSLTVVNSERKDKKAAVQDARTGSTAEGQNVNKQVSLEKQPHKNKQMFVKHLPPARSEYRVPQRPITKTGTKEGQLTQRYY